MTEHNEAQDQDNQEFANNIKNYCGLMTLRSIDPHHPITSEKSYLFAVQGMRATDFDDVARQLRDELDVDDKGEAFHWYASAAQGTSDRLEGIIELLKAVDQNVMLLDKDPRDRPTMAIVL